MRSPNVLLLYDIYILSLESSGAFPQSRDMGVRSTGDSKTVPFF